MKRQLYVWLSLAAWLAVATCVASANVLLFLTPVAYWTEKMVESGDWANPVWWVVANIGIAILAAVFSSLVVHKLFEWEKALQIKLFGEPVKVKVWWRGAK